MEKNFPIWVVKKILKEKEEKLHSRKNADKNSSTLQRDKHSEHMMKIIDEDKSHWLLLP